MQLGQLLETKPVRGSSDWAARYYVLIGWSEVARRQHATLSSATPVHGINHSRQIYLSVPSAAVRCLLLRGEERCQCRANHRQPSRHAKHTAKGLRRKWWRGAVADSAQQPAVTRL